MVTTKKHILSLLREVHDPEIPVLNIVELGIVHNVEIRGEQIHVAITPTYSGCPAMQMIRNDIIGTLNNNGFHDVKINTVYSPAWTSNKLDASAKEKLKEFGIAPPENTSEVVVALPDSRMKCPFCNSLNTELRSEFSSTACKSLYFCNDCSQPFEHFKEL
ncbi:MAG: phenylacetate-CoA oxygenase subunit PaaJ [Bacteroidota bacterium]|nr:phenylacetate-CoA oxygenase subunit PaaJ [Bacteroidota bacterium]